VAPPETITISVRGRGEQARQTLERTMPFCTSRGAPLDKRVFVASEVRVGWGE
jgi:hypothetical protein